MATGPTDTRPAPITRELQRRPQQNELELQGPLQQFSDWTRTENGFPAQVGENRCGPGRVVLCCSGPDFIFCGGDFIACCFAILDFWSIGKSKTTFSFFVERLKLTEALILHLFKTSGSSRPSPPSRAARPSRGGFVCVQVVDFVSPCCVWK